MNPNKLSLLFWLMAATKLADMMPTGSDGPQSEDDDSLDDALLTYRRLVGPPDATKIDDAEIRKAIFATKGLSFDPEDTKTLMSIYVELDQGRTDSIFTEISRVAPLLEVSNVNEEHCDGRFLAKMNSLIQVNDSHIHVDAYLDKFATQQAQLCMDLIAVEMKERNGSVKDSYGPRMTELRNLIKQQLPGADIKKGLLNSSALEQSLGLYLAEQGVTVSLSDQPTALDVTHVKALIKDQLLEPCEEIHNELDYLLRVYWLLEDLKGQLNDEETSDWLDNINICRNFKFFSLMDVVTMCKYIPTKAKLS